jgi:hypothetical protein
MIHVSVIEGNADFMMVEAGMMDYRSPALVLPGSGRLKAYQPNLKGPHRGMALYEAHLSRLTASQQK